MEQRSKASSKENPCGEESKGAKKKTETRKNSKRLNFANLHKAPRRLSQTLPDPRKPAKQYDPIKLPSEEEIALMDDAERSTNFTRIINEVTAFIEKIKLDKDFDIAFEGMLNKAKGEFANQSTGGKYD